MASSFSRCLRSLQADRFRLRRELERRQLRSPVTGRVGEIASLRAGSIVEQGERIGTVVPEGALRAVADFLPHVALGRIRPGQPARLRLRGFPWIQFGSISARVVSVAGEAREDRIRVEFSVQVEPSSGIPRKHGLPGTVEVQVERVSPATLVFRAAGKFLAGSSTTDDGR